MLYWLIDRNSGKQEADIATIERIRALVLRFNQFHQRIEHKTKEFQQYSKRITSLENYIQERQFQNKLEVKNTKQSMMDYRLKIWSELLAFISESEMNLLDMEREIHLNRLERIKSKFIENFDATFNEMKQSNANVRKEILKLEIELFGDEKLSHEGD